MRVRQRRRQEDDPDDFGDNRRDFADDTMPRDDEPEAPAWARTMFIAILATLGIGLILFFLLELDAEDLGGPWVLMPVLLIGAAFGRSFGRGRFRSAVRR